MKAPFAVAVHLAVASGLVGAIPSIASGQQVGSVVATQLERQALAPTGKLRVGVILGHPTHFVRDASGEVKGVTYDLAQEFAQRLGVPVEIVEFPLMAGVFDALRKGEVDFTLARATLARTKEIDFSPTILNIECGYLVRPGSGISSQDGIDRPGVRVGVTAGGVIHETLTRDLKSAVVIPTANMTDARKMFASGTIDAFAANKSILFEMADQTPESRVLDGRWGDEAFAVATPKGREQGARFLRAFLDAVTSDGLLQAAADRTHMRGIIRD
jgi:polar amino acid transport system substrate-binding protein